MARNREHLKDPLQNSVLGIFQSALEMPLNGFVSRGRRGS